MASEIYYFSGTGNSFKVAKDISNKLNAKLLPIIPSKEKETVKSNAEVIGVVFPIYEFKAPDLINNFIKKLSTPSSTYFFAVCTYGVMPLKTMKRLEKIFISQGKKLSGGFNVKMPHNGLGYSRIPIKKQKKMFKNWKIKCEYIIDYVKSRRQGTIEKSNVIDRIILIGLLIKLLPKVLPMLKQALFKGWDSLGFYADENCNTCKICEKVCPMDNIEMIEQKPKWGEKCLSCFACLQWCPKQSIQIANLTKKMERYHHPDVKLKDIINQKKEI
jgi:ferredoxin